MLAPMIRAPILRTARAHLHTSVPVRSAGGAPYHPLPFDFPGDRKAAFAAKLVAYLGFGFALPFIAVKIQQLKAAT